MTDGFRERRVFARAGHLQPAFDTAGFIESLPRKFDCFCPLDFFVVSLRLPQRHDKLSFPHFVSFYSC